MVNNRTSTKLADTKKMVSSADHWQKGAHPASPLNLLVIIPEKSALLLFLGVILSLQRMAQESKLHRGRLSIIKI